MAFPTAVNGQITDAVAPSENQASEEQAAGEKPQAKAEEKPEAGGEAAGESE